MTDLRGFAGVARYLYQLHCLLQLVHFSAHLRVFVPCAASEDPRTWIRRLQIYTATLIHGNYVKWFLRCWRRSASFSATWTAHLVSSVVSGLLSWLRQLGDSSGEDCGFKCEKLAHIQYRCAAALLPSTTHSLCDCEQNIRVVGGMYVMGVRVHHLSYTCVSEGFWSAIISGGNRNCKICSCSSTGPHVGI